jgi:dolichol-phosphate mannosyltransferase
MDADLQHPPELLRDLLAAIESGCDLAVGSRYAGRAGRRGGHPLRRWISAASIWMARPLQNPAMRVRDPMSGYFIVRRRCVENIVFSTAGFKLLLEILMRGRIRSVREIPFVFGRRRAGRSKAGLKVALQYMQLLVYLYQSRARELRTPPSMTAD